MLTVKDINDVRFRKTNIGGYKAEEVDNFLDEVQSSYESLQNENLDLKHKMKVLANRIKEYRQDEENVKIALLSAQKLASSAVDSAKKEAEDIIEDAKMEAKKILRDITEDLEAQRRNLAEMKKSVKEFKSDVLSLYKEQIRFINSSSIEDKVQNNVSETIQQLNNEERKETNLKTDFMDGMDSISLADSKDRITDLILEKDCETDKDENESLFGLFD